MLQWQQIVPSVLNIFSSPPCGLCDRPTADIICRDCQSQLNRCKLPNPERLWQSPLPVFAWGQYSGDLKRGIAALKYHNQPQMARLFGQWLGQQWCASAIAKQVRQSRRSLVVVPVPANEAKKKRRGYDQAELIAKAFCHYTKIPLDLQRVIRTEDTKPMYGLSAQERQRNVRGKFQLHPRFKPQQKHRRQAILLLDDIHTTGSTVNAIAHLLRQHQMSVYGTVALAKAGLGQDGPLDSLANQDE